MLTTMTALALLAFADPPDRKGPPSKAELEAITRRGRDLAGYDAAAWHASDAVMARKPKPGSVGYNPAGDLLPGVTTMRTIVACLFLATPLLAAEPKVHRDLPYPE